MILLTHHHGDHIAGIDEVRRASPAPSRRRRGGCASAAEARPGGEGRRHGEARQRHRPGDRHAGPYPRPDQLLLPRRRDAAVRRHAVQPGLRPADRGHCGGDVCLAAQARGPAGRHEGLLRPRIHREQRALRAQRRSRQRGAAGAHRRGAAAACRRPPTVPSTVARSRRPTRSCARPTSRPSPICGRRKTSSEGTSS